MHEDKIKAAMAEARAFLKRADAALKDRYDYEVQGSRLTGMNHGKASGALRRSSMELTRALSEMRKR
jgi:hypothetical protein